MPDDKPQVTVPSDEEIEQEAFNIATMAHSPGAQATRIKEVLRQVRDRTREATLLEAADGLNDADLRATRQKNEKPGQVNPQLEEGRFRAALQEARVWQERYNEQGKRIAELERQLAAYFGWAPDQFLRYQAEHRRLQESFKKLDSYRFELEQQFQRDRDAVMNLFPHSSTFDAAISHIKRDRERIEQTEVQLAGCSVAALGGTKEPAMKGQWGWSQAYQDVLELRIKWERDQERIKELEALVEWAVITHGKEWETAARVALAKKEETK